MNSTVVSPQPTLSANVHRGDPRAVQAILEAEGVLRTGHFALLSGLHSDTFLAFSAVAAQGDGVSAVANWLSPSVAAWAPTLIVSPTTAGVTLASELARRLSVPLLLALVDDDGRPSSLDGLDASHRALNCELTSLRPAARLPSLPNWFGWRVLKLSARPGSFPGQRSTWPAVSASRRRTSPTSN